MRDAAIGIATTDASYAIARAFAALEARGIEAVRAERANVRRGSCRAARRADASRPAPEGHDGETVLHLVSVTCG